MSRWRSINNLDCDAQGYILVSDGTEYGVWIAELDYDMDGNMIVQEKQECLWLHNIKHWMPIERV